MITKICPQCQVEMIKAETLPITVCRIVKEKNAYMIPPELAIESFDYCCPKCGLVQRYITDEGLELLKQYPQVRPKTLD